MSGTRWRRNSFIAAVIFGPTPAKSLSGLFCQPMTAAIAASPSREHAAFSLLMASSEAVIACVTATEIAPAALPTVMSSCRNPSVAADRTVMRASAATPSNRRGAASAAVSSAARCCSASVSSHSAARASSTSNRSAVS
jgi:hypothetical protein